MNDRTDPISLLLRQCADRVTLGDTPVRAIMARGARRRARRRSAVAAGALTVGAVGAAASISVLSRGDGADTISGTIAGTDGQAPVDDGTVDQSEPSGLAAAQLVPSPLVWNDVTVGSAEALVGFGWEGIGRTQSQAGTLYQLGTQPGRSQEPKLTLYRSEDGLRWTPTGLPTDLRAFGRILADGERLYAVGTASATSPLAGSADGRALISRSDDGGRTWVTDVAPLDASALADQFGVRAVNFDASVAVGPAGVLALARAVPVIDLEALMPGAEQGSVEVAPDGSGLVTYELVDDGCLATSTTSSSAVHAGATTPAAGTVTVEPTVTTSVVATQVAEATSTTTVVYGDSVPPQCASRGDETGRRGWDDLGLPSAVQDAMRSTGTVLRLTDGGDDEVLTAPVAPDGFRVHSSRIDGNDTGYVVLVTGVDYRAGTAAERTLGFTSTDGATWVQIPSLPMGWVMSTGTLADGSFAVAGSGAMQDGGPYVAVLRDGGWAVTDMRQLVADRPGTSVSQIAIGRQGIVAAGAEQCCSSGGSVPAQLLLSSVNGVDWAREALGDLVAGDERWITGVLVTDDSVLVSIGETISTNVTATTPLRDRTILVGTVRS